MPGLAGLCDDLANHVALFLECAQRITNSEELGITSSSQSVGPFRDLIFHKALVLGRWWKPSDWGMCDTLDGEVGEGSNLRDSSIHADLGTSDIETPLQMTLFDVEAPPVATSEDSEISDPLDTQKRKIDFVHSMATLANQFTGLLAACLRPSGKAVATPLATAAGLQNTCRLAAAVSPCESKN